MGFRVIIVREFGLVWLPLRSVLAGPPVSMKETSVGGEKNSAYLQEGKFPEWKFLLANPPRRASLVRRLSKEKWDHAGVVSTYVRWS